MVELKRSTIYAIGTTHSYNDLFNRINTECSSESSLNKLNFQKSVKDETGVYTLEITTKYYDLVLNVVVIGLEECLNKLENNDFEGLLLLVDNECPNETICNLLLKKFEENPACFKSVIRNESVSNHEEIIKKFEEVDDLIQIDLSEKGDDAEEAFSDLEEFINSIFVHSWSEMVMKSSPLTVVNQSTDCVEVEATNETTATTAATDGEKTTDEGAFTFEDMLMNLSEYKAKADGLEFEERKKFAEDIVRKFWKSIGGDEEEIDDLNE